jgi:hypothetical protein
MELLLCLGLLDVGLSNLFEESELCVVVKQLLAEEGGC